MTYVGFACGGNVLTTIVISLDCIAAVVTSRNRAGVI